MSVMNSRRFIACPPRAKFGRSIKTGNFAKQNWCAVRQCAPQKS